MTVYEKLKEEFGCAIMAILGDMADNDFDPENISASDIDAIARKVKFYLDLE
jgi:2-methylcitrate dehydratase PrpD